MKLEDIDMPTTLKVVLPLFVFVTSLIYIFLRTLIQKYFEAKRFGEMVENASDLHAHQKPKPPEIWKTDIHTKLNKKQKNLFKLAEDLFKQKKFRESAQMFEHLGFQRRAVDVLEQNGFIDEAAHVLIRMNLLNRAAVIYERNRYYEKAIDLYNRDHKPEMIAKIYEKMAWKDYAMYQPAADFYLKAGLVESALGALAKLSKNEEILKICLEQHKYEFLWNYLQFPFHAQKLLPQIEQKTIEVILEPLPLTPHITEVLGAWLTVCPQAEVLIPVFRKLGLQAIDVRQLWSFLPVGAVDALLPLLSEIGPQLPPPLFDIHRQVLAELGLDLAKQVLKAQ